MKLNDAIFGLIFLGIALLILWSVRTLPNVPGQDVGPAAFPALLALLLAICAVLLVVRGVRERLTQKWFERGLWTGSPRHVLSFSLIVAGLIFYVLAAENLGFFLCAIVILVALFLSLQVRAIKAVPLAVTSTLVVHTIFYKFLKVPLPWGPLPVMW
jgi:putative tricarboxylic transport membrane protein